MTRLIDRSESNCVGDDRIPSLLAAAHDGDEDAAEELWRWMRAYLVEMARGQLGKDLQRKLGASDIVQQSLLEVQRDLPAFNGYTEQELKCWLRRLIRHNLEDAGRHYRHAQCRSIARETFAGDGSLHRFADTRQLTGSEIICRDETDRRLANCVARLSSGQRDVVLMRHRDGLDYSEIARRLEITEVAARKIWSRGLQSLRELMQADEYRIKRR